MPLFIAPIVGAHFRPPARAILAKAPMGLALVVRPEPTNAYDPQAVAVYVTGEALRGLIEPQREAMNAELFGFGFEFQELIADGAPPEWHLGYIAAKPPKGSTAHEGMLAADASRALAGQERTARLGFAASGQPEVMFEVSEESEDPGEGE